MSLSTEFRFHHFLMKHPVPSEHRSALQFEWCGDKYIGVKTVFSQGKYRDAGEVLNPGVRLG